MTYPMNICIDDSIKTESIVKAIERCTGIIALARVVEYYELSITFSYLEHGIEIILISDNDRENIAPPHYPISIIRSIESLEVF